MKRLSAEDISLACWSGRCCLECFQENDLLASGPSSLYSSTGV